MRFWIVADSDRRPPSDEEAAAGWRWRHRVDLAFDGQEVLVAVSATAPTETHAAVVSPREALSATWADHLDRADAGWLLPWLRRAADGEDALEVPVLDELRRRTGLGPESYDWDLPRHHGR